MTGAGAWRTSCRMTEVLTRCGGTPVSRQNLEADRIHRLSGQTAREEPLRAPAAGVGQVLHAPCVSLVASGPATWRNTVSSTSSPSRAASPTQRRPGSPGKGPIFSTQRQPHWTRRPGTVRTWSWRAQDGAARTDVAFRAPPFVGHFGRGRCGSPRCTELPESHSRAAGANREPWTFSRGAGDAPPRRWHRPQ